MSREGYITLSCLKERRQVADFGSSVRVAVLLLASCMAGCGGDRSSPLTSAEAEHIGKVGHLIKEFKSANSENNPKSLDELKNWAIRKGKAEENDFISTRDQQPYVLESMVMPRKGGPGGDMSFMAAKLPVVVHEAEGKNGRRFVLQGTSPMGREMSEESMKYLTKGGPDTKGK